MTSPSRLPLHRLRLLLLTAWTYGWCLRSKQEHLTRPRPWEKAS